MQYITMTTELPPFLPYPRFLLELPLSETARLVYCVLLSRILVSQHNGWVDDAGRVYCRYPILSLAKDCSRGKSAILTAVAALEKQGLLTRQKGGAGRANTLFLRVPENGTPEVPETAPQTSGNANLRGPESRTPDLRKTAPQRSGKRHPNYTTNYTTNKTTNYKNRKPDYDYIGDSL